jgi:hypothetical protein
LEKLAFHSCFSLQADCQNIRWCYNYCNYLPASRDFFRLSGQPEVIMPELIRKRLIPDEYIPLDDDKILYESDETIVTAWKTLHPKAEFSHGYSCYFLKKGWKVSRFYTADNTQRYIYCDVIRSDYDKNSDTWIFTDLLADVIVENDGFVRVVDLDELADALDRKILTPEGLSSALRSLNELLTCIYSGTFKNVLINLDEHIPG